MNIKEFAKQINEIKRYYRNEFTKEEIQLAKDNDFVLVTGYSDDNAEFYGAICDEVDCFNGGRVFKQGKYYIDAICGKDIMWTYETNIPHETFDIWENYDDGIYCKGIIFDIKSIKANKEKKPIDYNTLHDWYISSVDNESEPVWTSAHLEELMKDFILIPKDE